MTATPIIPGHAYRVRTSTTSYTILASHGCDAILRVLEIVGGAQ